MVQITERSAGSRYFIEKEEDAESYCIYDVSTGEKVGDPFATRREAAAELKVLLNKPPEKKPADDKSDEADAADEGDNEL